MEEASTIDSLADELWVSIAAFLPAADLLRFGSACRRAHGLPTDALWRALCEKRWAGWPHYKLSPAREAWLEERLPATTWCARYQHTETDAARTTMTHEDVCSLNWHFNFTPSAGGQGKKSLMKASFSETQLFIPEFAPLDYQLVTPGGIGAAAPEAAGDGNGGALYAFHSLVTQLLTGAGEAAAAGGGGDGTQRQFLQISHFPPHWVERLADSRCWLVYNDNVTLVSCGPDFEPGDYDERGFLTVPTPAG